METAGFEGKEKQREEIMSFYEIKVSRIKQLNEANT